MSFIEIMIVGEIMALPDGVFLSPGGIISLVFVVVSFSILITGSSPEYLDELINVVKSKRRRGDFHGDRPYIPVRVFAMVPFSVVTSREELW